MKLIQKGSWDQFLKAFDGIKDREGIDNTAWAGFKAAVEALIASASDDVTVEARVSFDEFFENVNSTTKGFQKFMEVCAAIDPVISKLDESDVSTLQTALKQSVQSQIVDSITKLDLDGDNATGLAADIRKLLETRDDATVKKTVADLEDECDSLKSDLSNTVVEAKRLTQLTTTELSTAQNVVNSVKSIQELLSALQTAWASLDKSCQTLYAHEKDLQAELERAIADGKTAVVSGSTMGAQLTNLISAVQSVHAEVTRIESSAAEWKGVVTDVTDFADAFRAMRGQLVEIIDDVERHRDSMTNVGIIESLTKSIANMVVSAQAVKFNGQQRERMLLDQRNRL